LIKLVIERFSQSKDLENVFLNNIKLDKPAITIKQFPGSPVENYINFITQICNELSSSSLLIATPNTQMQEGENQHKLMLNPKMVLFSETEVLIFFGKLIGMSIKST